MNSGGAAKREVKSVADLVQKSRQHSMSMEASRKASVSPLASPSTRWCQAPQAPRCPKTPDAREGGVPRPCWEGGAGAEGIVDGESEVEV